MEIPLPRSMSRETSGADRPNARSSSKNPPPGAVSRKPGSTHRVTIDRLLSRLGIASRSQAQQWIRAGRISVNQRVVRTPDMWVSWPGDQVSLDDRTIEDSPKRFLLFHKPKGVVTTHSDEKGRKTIFDVLPADCRTLHAVGRLDQATSGLLLLTNDSTLSSFLTDPRNHVTRRYLVTVRGKVTEETRQSALTGLIDQGDRLHCETATIQKSSGRESHLEVTLTEGKNREIRRLWKALGHEVTRLRRIQFGPFFLGDLQPGTCREFPFAEATALLKPQP